MGEETKNIQIFAYMYCVQLPAGYRHMQQFLKRACQCIKDQRIIIWLWITFHSRVFVLYDMQTEGKQLKRLCIYLLKIKE